MTIEQKTELYSEVLYEIEQYQARHRIALSQPFPAAYHLINLGQLRVLKAVIELTDLSKADWNLKWFESFSGYRASN